MARAIKYRLQFKSLNGTGCLVNVYVEGATSSADETKTGANVPFSVETGVTELIGTADPFTFEETDDDNLLEFVRTKSGYLNVIESNVGDLNGLMPTSRTSHFIEAYYGDQKVFVGYLSPQVFENDWAAGPLERSFPVMSPLGLLGDLKFVPPRMPALVSLGSLMQEVVNGLNSGYTHVISPKPYNRENASVSNYFPWDGKIFSLSMTPYNTEFNPQSQVSELYSPKTYRDFIEGICKCFGWLVHDDGSKIVFQDVSQNRLSVARQYTIANLTAWQTYDNLSKSSPSTWHLYMEDFNDDSSISLAPPLSKLTLKYADTDEYLYDGINIDHCTIDSLNLLSKIHTFEIEDMKLVRTVQLAPETDEVTVIGAALVPEFNLNDGILQFRNNCFVPMQWGVSESDRKTISMQSGWLLGNPGLGNQDVKIRLHPHMPMAFIGRWLLKINIKAGFSFNHFPDSGWQWGDISIGVTVNSAGKSYRFTYIDGGGTKHNGHWENFTGTVNMYTPNQDGDIIGVDTISSNVTDYNLTDTNGLLINPYGGNGKLNDDFEIIITIPYREYEPGTMMLFDVEIVNPEKELQQYFYEREKEHVFYGSGINEETLDITLNNYGEYRTLNSFCDANMLMSTYFMPDFSYMLNRTLKILRQNAKKTGDIPATVGSIYVPQMQLYNQTGYWSVISCSLNMRDDKYRLTRIPIYQ